MLAESERNNNIGWSVFLIVLTMLVIIPCVGIQSKDIHDVVTLGMPVTSVIANYFMLFIMFPVCYFIFIRHARKLKRPLVKGFLFLIQGAGILICAFCIVDNSHPGVNMNTEAGLSYHRSDTQVFVYIIPAIALFIAAIYFVSGSRKSLPGQ